MSLPVELVPVNVSVFLLSNKGIDYVNKQTQHVEIAGPRSLILDAKKNTTRKYYLDTVVGPQESISLFGKAGSAVGSATTELGSAVADINMQVANEPAANLSTAPTDTLSDTSAVETSVLESTPAQTNTNHADLSAVTKLSSFVPSCMDGFNVSLVYLN